MGDGLGRVGEMGEEESKVPERNGWDGAAITGCVGKPRR